MKKQTVKQVFMGLKQGNLKAHNILKNNEFYPLSKIWHEISKE